MYVFFSLVGVGRLPVCWFAGLLVCWFAGLLGDKKGYRSGLLMNILLRRGVGVGTIMFYLVGESLFTYFGSLAYVP